MKHKAKLSDRETGAGEKPLRKRHWGRDGSHEKGKFRGLPAEEAWKVPGVQIKKSAAVERGTGTVVRRRTGEDTGTGIDSACTGSSLPVSIMGSSVEASDRRVTDHTCPSGIPRFQTSMLEDHQCI